MSAKQHWARRFATLVVLLGAITTIATSGEEVGVETHDEETFTLQVNVPRFVTLTYNEAAMDHARRAEVFDVDLRAGFAPAEGGVTVTPENGSLPERSGQRADFFFGAEGCPDTGACTVGFTVELTSVPEPYAETEVNVFGRITALSASTAEEFPEDATVTIEVDE